MYGIIFSLLPRRLLHGQRGILKSCSRGSETLDRTFEALGEMFEGESADRCALQTSILSLGGSVNCTLIESKLLLYMNVSLSS